jgi:hypothetical protein
LVCIWPVIATAVSIRVVSLLVVRVWVRRADGIRRGNRERKRAQESEDALKGSAVVSYHSCNGLVVVYPFKSAAAPEGVSQIPRIVKFASLPRGQLAEMCVGNYSDISKYSGRQHSVNLALQQQIRGAGTFSIRPGLCDSLNLGLQVLPAGYLGQSSARYNCSSRLCS